MQFDDSISGDVEILTSQGISIPFNFDSAAGLSRVFSAKQPASVYSGLG